MKEIKDSMYFITGGYILDLDVVSEDSRYINLYNLPVYYNSLSRLLNEKICKQDRAFKYDTETFLKDIYENLISNILKDGEIVLQSIKKSTPKNIKIMSIISYFNYIYQLR